MRGAARPEDVGLIETEMEAAEEDEIVPAGPNDALVKLLTTQSKLLTKLATQGSGPSNHGTLGWKRRGQRERQCLRCPYIRLLEKHAEFSASVARRAQAELGLSSQHPGMMRAYMERKVPSRTTAP